MAGLLDDAAIQEFALPIGRLMLAYANFETAVTAMLEALQEIDDRRRGKPEAAPSKPLRRRMDLLKSLLRKGDHEERFRKELLKTLTCVKTAIEDRHACVHGEWWMNPTDHRIYTRKFSRGCDLQCEPEHRLWTPSEVDRVATDLLEAARDLEYQAHQLKRGRKIG